MQGPFSRVGSPAKRCGHSSLTRKTEPVDAELDPVRAAAGSEPRQFHAPHDGEDSLNPEPVAALDPTRSAPAGGVLYESPWVWTMLFAVCGLILLMAIGPKHARRQTRLDRMADARHQAFLRRGQQQPASASGNASPGSLMDEAAGPATAHWRALAMVLVGVSFVAGWGLYREQRRAWQNRLASQSPGEPDPA